MKFNKKSMEITGVTLGLIIGVLVFVVMIGIFRPGAASASEITSSSALKAQDQKCIFDAELAADRGVKFDDKDSDGRPDACDVCVSSDGKSTNYEDKDLDGMPDYCDTAPTDRTISACKFGPLTKDKRCVEGNQQ